MSAEMGSVLVLAMSVVRVDGAGVATGVDAVVEACDMIQNCVEFWECKENENENEVGVVLW